MQLLADEDAPSGLTEAVSRLSERYRKGVDDGSPAMRTEAEHTAYLISRMPATTAAVGAALAHCRARIRSRWTSVLDLGSGPGSALWAICGLFAGLEQVTALERDSALIAHGQRLAKKGPKALASAVWLRADLRAPPVLTPHDLVVFSYSLGELPEGQRLGILDQAWTLANKSLLIVEPGTPRGFGCVRAAREHLLAKGAHVAAPCTHALRCPLSATSAEPGWCRFSVRLPRSRLHRAAKDATLGFEDEPYSYVLLQKEPVANAGQRIVAPPKVHKGAVDLLTCSQLGITPVSIPRKSRNAYAAASKLEWGDWME